MTRIPQHLYKYRSLTGEQAKSNARRLICESVVWLAAPSTFLDREDLQPRVPSDSEAVSDKGPMGPAVRFAKYEAVAPVAIDFSRCFTDDAFGVCSLTDLPLNREMWLDYADAGAGICVDCDFLALARFVQGTRGLYLQQVEYVPILSTTLSPFLKLLHWSFEREWRLLMDYHDVSEIGGCRERSLVLPKGVISGVMIGPNATFENRREVAAWCSAARLPVPTELETI